ncbi:hypothetical protein QBC35DRAFT_211408 [Podospora australis]|uniref:Uncharacterized protein n=1 Tax=Podospora australis TaxID=1536484 RepID=A0AAN6WX48_9PEZI|nr:hypothetical protein QBC35DRAFT_211408 [Podospora australis]
MDFWKDASDNETTTDASRWLLLMNHSTAKLGLSPFPPNLVAVAGPLNASLDYDIPNGTLVISDIFKPQQTPADLDRLVFGVVCVLAALWAAAWVTWTWWKFGSLLKPRVPPSQREDFDDENGMELPGHRAIIHDNPDYISSSAFHERFLRFYYDIGNEHEVPEKDPSKEAVEATDVEAVMALVQKMYEIDVELFGLQNALYVGDERREKLRQKRETILAEVARVAELWGDRRYLHVNNWQKEEWESVLAILDMLKDNGQAGPIRYP